MKIKQTKSSKKSSKQTIFEHKRVGRTIFVNNANFSNFFSLLSVTLTTFGPHVLNVLNVEQHKSNSRVCSNFMPFLFHVFCYYLLCVWSAVLEGGHIFLHENGLLYQIEGYKDRHPTVLVGTLNSPQSIGT